MLTDMATEPSWSQVFAFIGLFVLFLFWLFKWTNTNRRDDE